MGEVPQEQQLMPIEAVLNELDGFATQWDLMRQEEGGWRCRRRRSRRKFRASCDVWLFEDRGTSVKQQRAQTRNLSERGLGLLTRCVVHAGTPIEIRIAPPGRPPTHLGGIVAFCRYASHGLHEVGVELKVHQQKPIFADDPMGAIARTPWIQEALRRVLWENRAGRRRTTTTK